MTYRVDRLAGREGRPFGVRNTALGMKVSYVMVGNEVVALTLYSTSAELKQLLPDLLQPG